MSSDSKNEHGFLVDKFSELVKNDNINALTIFFDGF